MDLDLAGRFFLVAGGTRGLGLGVAQALLAEGAAVSICGRDPARLAEALAGLGGLAEGRAVDLCDPAALAGWVEEAATRHGSLDGLLINAGGPPKGAFEAFDDAGWQAAFTLTLLSAVRLARAARPHLVASGGGSLVALTSTSVREPIDFLILSNVMRAGVASLVKSLARSWAGEGIRVNSLIPGFIATERLAFLEGALAAEAGRPAAEQRRLLEAEIPLGRYGAVAEFARAAAFLLSPASSYVTGASLVVDGGRLRGI
jgi:3-oxoacyl-[acyl-carrier protein] reductase